MEFLSGSLTAMMRFAMPVLAVRWREPTEKGYQSLDDRGLFKIRQIVGGGRKRFCPTSVKCLQLLSSMPRADCCRFAI